MKKGFDRSSGVRALKRMAVRGLGLSVALMAAQAGFAGSAQAAYLTYDFSLDGVTDGGDTLSLGATLTLNGVSQAPTTGYLYDTDNTWTITINQNFTEFAGLSVFGDTGGGDSASGGTYLKFDGGAITGSFFRGFYSLDDNGNNGYYTDPNSGMDVLYEDGVGSLAGYNSLTPRPTTDPGSGGTDPGSGGTDPGPGDTDPGSGSTDPVPTGDVPSVTAAVPEPSTWAMMIGGFGLVGAALRRRKRAPFASALA